MPRVRKSRPKKQAAVWVVSVVVLLVSCGGGGVLFQMLSGSTAKKQEQAQEEEKVTRDNFNRLRQRMRLKDAEEILGPAKENSRLDRSLQVGWQSRNGRCVIAATFQVGETDAWLTDKAIMDD